MSKGLAKLLDSITNNPDQRLIDRYLALITDIENESEKRARALDLAATLVNQKSDEAMRIAHMVFKADPQNLRSLDIIIESLEDRGSKGKAAVLRNERAKLVSLKDEQPEKLRADATTYSPELNLDFSGIKTPSHSDSSKDKNVDVPINVDLPNRPFNISHNEKQIPKNISDFQYKANAEKAMFPTDVPNRSKDPTVSPDETYVISSNDAADLDISMRFHTVVDGDALSHLHNEEIDSPTEYIYQPGQILENPPKVENSDLGVGVELFDYYWRQGFVGRAQKLLEQMAPLAGEETWWQARNKLLKNSNLDFEINERIESSGSLAIKSASEESEEIWKEVLSSYNEICPEDDTIVLKSDFFLKIAKVPIASLTQATTDKDGLFEVINKHEFKQAESRRLFFAMLANYLWSSKQDEHTIQFLREAGIEDFSLRIWGIYLDALVHAQQGRKARFEIFKTLSKNPHLPWAKSAYSRLNDVFDLLGVQKFEWNEDDGVQPLIKAVSSSRPLNMSAVLV